MSRAAGEARVALVTGATRGIGLATALRLAADGYAVGITYSRDEQAATAAADALEREAPGRVAAIRADATSWEDGERAVAEAERRLGPLWALVNNVGVGMLKRLEDCDAERWRRMWSLNLESAVIHSTAAGRRMLERGGGAIVNLSSMSASRAFERRGPHCVAKAGLEMLTRCQALEWGPRGIRANAVAPGVVATDEVMEMISSGVIEPKGALAGVPLGKFAVAGDVAAAVAFLVGEDAAHVNGHVLAVDGGWSAAGGPL